MLEFSPEAFPRPYPLNPSPLEFQSLSLPKKDCSSAVIVETRLCSVLDLRSMEQFARRLPFKTSNVDDTGVLMANVRQGGTAKNISHEALTIIEMLRKVELINFVSALLGERYYAEDCQIHQMRSGAHLPVHHHAVDSVFGVFHLSQTYQGGKYYEESNGIRTYPIIPSYSLLLSRGEIDHGVEEVISGERMTIVTAWSRSSRKS